MLCILMVIGLHSVSPRLGWYPAPSFCRVHARLREGRVGKMSIPQRGSWNSITKRISGNCGQTLRYESHWYKRKEKKPSCSTSIQRAAVVWTLPNGHRVPVEGHTRGVAMIP